MAFFIALLIAAVIIGIAIPIATSIANKNKAAELKAIETFSVGKYIGGLAGQNVPRDASCAVNDDGFNLIAAGNLLGVIPRPSLRSVHVEDHSQVKQRMTATRLATLGVFALAVPKKTTEKKHFMTVEWEDERGVQQQTMFEFANPIGNVSQIIANKAADCFRKYAIGSRTGERKCPYCAEMIKSEARICRFCQQPLIR